MNNTTPLLPQTTHFSPRHPFTFRCRHRSLLHVLALSRAHMESVMLAEMLAGVAACVDPDCRRSLKALADLFALDRIYSDVLFRNDDYIAPEKVRCEGAVRAVR